MDVRGLGIVSLGLALPSVAAYLWGTGIGQRASDMVGRLPFVSSWAGQAALTVATTAAVSWAISGGLGKGLKFISPAEALTANMIALGLVAVSVAKAKWPAALPGGGIVDSMPSAGALAGGYSGTYGYLGNPSVGEEMLPAPVSDGMFGVKANVF